MKKRTRPRPSPRLINAAQLARTTGGIGDLGNDWLAGGTGRDGATGGAGLDVLIGNTGGDR